MIAATDFDMLSLTFRTLHPRPMSVDARSLGGA
jgi:hypothetical protein